MTSHDWRSTESGKYRSPQHCLSKSSQSAQKIYDKFQIKVRSSNVRINSCKTFVRTVLRSRETLISPVLSSHMSSGGTLPGPIEVGWRSIKGSNPLWCWIVKDLTSSTCSDGTDFNAGADTHSSLWRDLQCFCWCSLEQ